MTNFRRWIALRVLWIGKCFLTDKEWEEFVFQLHATWVNRCKERGYPVPSDFYKGF